MTCGIFRVCREDNCVDVGCGSTQLLGLGLFVLGSCVIKSAPRGAQICEIEDVIVFCLKMVRFLLGWSSCSWSSY